MGWCGAVRCNFIHSATPLSLVNGLSCVIYWGEYTKKKKKQSEISTSRSMCVRCEWILLQLLQAMAVIGGWHTDLGICVEPVIYSARTKQACGPICAGFTLLCVTLPQSESDMCMQENVGGRHGERTGWNHSMADQEYWVRNVKELRTQTEIFMFPVAQTCTSFASPLPSPSDHAQSQRAAPEKADRKSAEHEQHSSFLNPPSERLRFRLWYAPRVHRMPDGHPLSDTPPHTGPSSEYTNQQISSGSVTGSVGQPDMWSAPNHSHADDLQGQ